jgi:hypothetical protein
MRKSSQVCEACKDKWPNDEEFYRENSTVCLACEAEGFRSKITNVKSSTRGYRTPEADQERQKKKYLRHKDKYRERMKKYYEQNKEKINAARRAKYRKEVSQ